MYKKSHRKSINIPNHAHELTFSCYHYYPLLSKDRTRQWLADSINSAREELDLSIWAYVFMPNHVHLVVYPRNSEYNISSILKAIKHPVSRQALKWLRENSSQWLPKLAQKRGMRTKHHFWQIGGGYDRNIESYETLDSMIDYIHANPIRRGLTEKASDWKWSSSRWYEIGEVGPIAVDPIE